MNIEYIGFLGWGFQGKNLHLVSRLCWLQGDAFVVKGLAQDCDNACYSARSVVSIFQVKINGEKFENGDREGYCEKFLVLEAQDGRYFGG
jgi:hypothetical protein